MLRFYLLNHMNEKVIMFSLEILFFILLVFVTIYVIEIIKTMKEFNRLSKHNTLFEQKYKSKV